MGGRKMKLSQKFLPAGFICLMLSAGISSMLTLYATNNWKGIPLAVLLVSSIGLLAAGIFIIYKVED